MLSTPYATPWHPYPQPPYSAYFDTGCRTTVRREFQTFGGTSTSRALTASGAGGVSDVRALFVKLLLEDYPNMFDRIKARRVGKVLVDLNVALLKSFSNN